jgi:hypothetical protein
MMAIEPKRTMWRARIGSGSKREIRWTVNEMKRAAGGLDQEHEALWSRLLVFLLPLQRRIELLHGPSLGRAPDAVCVQQAIEPRVLVRLEGMDPVRADLRGIDEDVNLLGMVPVVEKRQDDGRGWRAETWRERGKENGGAIKKR